MSPVQHPSLRRVEKLAYWLDEFITVPGTGFKIGLESLIGLIPGAGDIAGLLVGGYVVVEAHRLGAPTELKLRMVRNLVLDATLGLVPVLGDFFDFAYRSNRRNVQMLLAHYRPTAPVVGGKRRPWWPWLLAVAAAAALYWVWWR